MAESAQHNISDQRKTVIRGQWVLGMDDGEQVLLRNRNVVIEGPTIIAVTEDDPGPADEVIEIEHSLVLPGFINLHSHCLNGALFRGIPDDMRLEPWITRLIYGVLMPLAETALKNLSPDEIRAVIKLGLLDLLKGGSTTVMDVFHAGQEVFFDVAREMGVRVYGTPYVMSTSKLGMGPDGKPTYEVNEGDDASLDRAVEVFRRYDEGDSGRIRVALGPHGADTCSPDLLRAVRETADDLGCLINMHLAQTPEELEILRQRYDKGPIEYVEGVGLLGPDLMVAHCVYATDQEIGVLRNTGTTVANCPISFARAGINVPFHRFAGQGVRTGIGTDSHGMDFVDELRIAGFFSKLHAAKGYVATARDLVRAGTMVGAEALQRPDLGRIAPGARADLLVVDLAQPHLQPVWDPVKNLIWKGGGADMSVVMVDGEVMVRDRIYLRGDEGAIIRDAAAAASKVWEMAADAGILQRPYV